MSSRAAVLVCFAVSVFASSARAEAVILVQPVGDHNDRIRAILGSTDPPLEIQHIGLNRVDPPQLWGRASHET